MARFKSIVLFALADCTGCPTKALIRQFCYKLLNKLTLSRFLKYKRWQACCGYQIKKLTEVCLIKNSNL